MDLSDVEPIALIQDLTTSWSRYDISVNDNVQIGDPLFNVRIWKRHDNRDNVIKSLPDYLVGGEMILGLLNDKNAWNWNFYQFSAGVTIDLYLIKHKDSNISLDETWELVDQDVEISDIYFKAGADVYHKIVKRGEYVEVGGSAMWKEGAPNLIIAKRNLSADLNIFSPNPAKELYPVSTNWYTSTSIKGELNRSWSYKIADGDWMDLGNSFSGEFNIPYLHTDETLELKVEVEATNPVDSTKTDIITKTRLYDVKNRSDIEISEPVSGSQILLNSGTPIDYVTTDLMGTPVYREVTWSIDNGEINNNYIYPEAEGITDITSEFNTYEDWSRVNNLKLNVVEEYQRETFTFDMDLTDEYIEHEDGRTYGFSKDFKHRLGETTYINVPYGRYWSRDRVTKMFIALEENSSFEYLVNNGYYKVKVIVGPLRRDRNFTYLKLEDDMHYFNTYYRSQIYQIDTTVEVKDNKLTLTGSKDMQILSLEITRTDEFTDTVIEPIDSYRIMTNQQWYKWDPGHYHPNFRWDYREEELVEIIPNIKKDKKNNKRGDR